MGRIKEESINKLAISSMDKALEIMCDEGNMICSCAQAVEVIETDCAKAYKRREQLAKEQGFDYTIYCGDPVLFLKKKIEDNVEYDVIVLNVERLEQSSVIWELLKKMKPSIVIVGFEKKKLGEYHKKLMVKNGFKLLQQEVVLSNEISRKFCVGCCN